MRRWLLGLLALVTVALCGLSCNRSAAALPDFDAELAAARETAQKQGPRAAIGMYERILASARSTHSRKYEGLALGQMGTAYKNLGDYDRAMDLHQQALAIKREAGDEVEVAKTLGNMGLVEWARGDCQKALGLYSQALDTFTKLDQPRSAASVLNNQGLCYDDLGDFRQSTSAYQRALALHRQQGNDTGESEALGNLGGIALLLGRYDEATRAYGQSLTISTRLDNKQSMALDLINLGLARLGSGDFKAAQAHLERARGIAHDAGLLREELDASRDLSTLFEQTGRYDDARAALNDVAGAYARTGLAQERVEALQALGRLELDLGDLGRAEAAFDEASADAARLKSFSGQLAADLALAAVELRRHNPDKAAAAAERARRTAATADDSASVASALTWLAHIRLSQGRQDEAMAAATGAYDAAVKTNGLVAVTEARLVRGDVLSVVKQYDEAIGQYEAVLRDDAAGAVPDLVWRAAFGRGRVLEAQGHLDRALADYLRAADTIERVRAQLSADRARTGFLDDKRDVYAALVRLLLKMGRTREAFQVAERLRAEGYRELVERSLILEASGERAIPASLLARIRQIQASIETELHRPVAEQRGEAVTQFHSELREAEEAWSAATSPRGAGSRWIGSLSPDQQTSAEGVQGRLHPGDALVEYVVDRDQTAVFVLTRAAIRARLLPIGASELRTRIELLRGLLARQESDGWQAIAERLDADLVAPLRDAGWLRGTTRLYVVPHAELNYLPFAVLRHSGASGPRLLVDDVAPVMLPAAAALGEPKTMLATSSAPLLAMAPERARLPFARQEVESLGTLFPSPEILVGRSATESKFKQDAGHFRILHLATHGFFNRLDPLFSGVELEPGGNEDGRLEVYEILGLPLHADLVTLSACDTALGSGELSDLPAGEELIGLTRAFLSAGSHDVLATLWAINDRTTGSLMTEFYQAARTRAYPEALALVQRSRAHREGQDAHPWHWAAFVIAEGQVPAEGGRAGP